MKAILLIALAGCGDDILIAPDGGPIARPCAAQFSGNFNDASATVGNCPTVTVDAGDTSLAFAVGSQALGTPLAVSIELGHGAGAGMYSSETVGTWTALATAGPEQHQCYYAAGSGQVPQGSFTLALGALDPAHGTLELTVYVLAQPFVACGTSNVEQITVMF
jgi:hypothetical protein